MRSHEFQTWLAHVDFLTERQLEQACAVFDQCQRAAASPAASESVRRAAERYGMATRTAICRPHSFPRGGKPSQRGLSTGAGAGTDGGCLGRSDRQRGARARGIVNFACRTEPGGGFGRGTSISGLRGGAGSAPQGRQFVGREAPARGLAHTDRQQPPPPSQDLPATVLRHRRDVPSQLPAPGAADRACWSVLPTGPPSGYPGYSVQDVLRIEPSNKVSA